MPSWKTIGDAEYIVITFRGEFTEKYARKLIPEVEAMAAGRSSVRMVWDALEMTNYETEARVLWQDMLKRVNVDDIVLISESRLIRIGADFVSMFAGVDIRAVGSWDAVEP